MKTEKYYELNDEIEALVYDKNYKPIKYELFYRTEVFMATLSKKYKDSYKAFIDEERFFYMPKIIVQEVLQ